MAETSVPLSETSFARLNELARWAGVSVNDALDQAIKDQYDRKFWDAVNTGYAALRADPAAWADVEAERKVWDATLLDGLDPSERWTEDGGVMPRPGPERPHEQRSGAPAWGSVAGRPRPDLRARAGRAQAGPGRLRGPLQRRTVWSGGGPAHYLARPPLAIARTRQPARGRTPPAQRGPVRRDPLDRPSPAPRLLGAVSSATMMTVEDRLRRLLGL
jgi:hypothetical protein